MVCHILKGHKTCARAEGQEQPVLYGRGCNKTNWHIEESLNGRREEQDEDGPLSLLHPRRATTLTEED